MAEPRSRAAEVTTRRAAGDIAVQIAGQAVNLGLGIVVTVILARGLGATDFGQWATLLATIQLVALIGNLGLEQVATRYAAQEPENEGLWVGAATSLQLTLAIPALLAFLVVLTFVAKGHQMTVAGIVLSVLFLTGAISTLRVVFRMHIRNHVFIAFLTVNSVLWAGSVIAIAALGGGLVAYSVAFVAVSVLVQGAMALVALRAVDVRWRGVRKHWPKLLRVGVAIGIASALTFTYGRVDQLLVYRLAPHSAEVGIYAAVYKILESAGAVPQAVMTTLFPIMATLYPGTPGRLRQIMQAAFDYLTVVSLGGLALTIVAAGPIIQLLYGSEYAQSSNILPILFAAFVPICIGNVAGNMVVVTEQQRAYVWFAVVGLVVNLALNFVLIPAHGIEGAAWATLGTEIVVVGIMTVAVLRRMEMRVSIGRMLRAAVAAAIAGFCLLGLREVGFGAIALTLSMAALYPPLLLVLRAIDVAEARELLRARRESRPA